MRIQPKAVLTHELQAGEAFPQGQHRPLHGHLSRQQVLLASPLGKRKQRPDLIVLHRCHRIPAATPQRPQIFGSAEFHFFSSPCFPALGQPTGRKKKKNGASGTGASRPLLGWRCSELPVHWLSGVHGQRRAQGPGILGSARGGERDKRTNGRGRPSFQETGVLVIRYELRGFSTLFFFSHTDARFSQVFAFSFVNHGLVLSHFTSLIISVFNFTIQLDASVWVRCIRETLYSQHVMLLFAAICVCLCYSFFLDDDAILMTLQAKNSTCYLKKKKSVLFSFPDTRELPY